MRNMMRMALATGAVLAVAVGGVAAVGEAAHAEPVRPAGTVACDALWMHSHTVADEDRCRERGWTVEATYIISASGDRMWTGYGPCATEDSRRCTWNARTQGNRCGWGFVQMGRLGTFTGLVEINGERASRPCPRCGPQR